MILMPSILGLRFISVIFDLQSSYIDSVYVMCLANCDTESGNYPAAFEQPETESNIETTIHLFSNAERMEIMQPLLLTIIVIRNKS